MWPACSVLHAEYTVGKDTVWCRYPGGFERIVPWGPEAEASAQGATGQWAPVEPRFTIGELERVVAIYSRGRILPSRKGQLTALRFLLAAWPEEVKRRVRRFPGPHWPMLRFLSLGGEAAVQLTDSNAALAWLAAKAGDASLAGARRRTIAGRAGFPESESAVRMLGKIAAEQLSAQLVDHLRRLAARGGEVLEVLSHAGQLNRLVLEAAEQGLPREELTRLGRVDGLAAPFSLEEQLRRARERGLAPRRLEDLGGVQTRPKPENLRFPDPPVEEAEGIAAIRTREQLVAEGEAMRHCAGREERYARGVAAGRLYFYRMSVPERATICIKRSVRGWGIEQVSGPGNAAVRPSTMRVIRGWLGLEGRSPRRRAPRVDARQLAFDFA